jgi:hypothetical protein
MEINFLSSWNLFLSQKGSKPPKMLLYEDKTLGRCPKPYQLFEMYSTFAYGKSKPTACRPTCRCVVGQKLLFSLRYLYIKIDFLYVE